MLVNRYTATNACKALKKRLHMHVIDWSNFEREFMRQDVLIKLQADKYFKRKRKEANRG